MKCIFIDEGHIKVRWLLALAQRDEDVAAEEISLLPDGFPEFDLDKDLVGALGVKPSAFSNWFAEPTKPQGAKTQFNRPPVRVARDIAKIFGFAPPSDNDAAWRGWWKDSWRSFMPSENDRVNRSEKAPAENFKRQYREALKNGGLTFPPPKLPRPGESIEAPLQAPRRQEVSNSEAPEAAEAAEVPETVPRSHPGEMLRIFGPTIVGGIGIAQGIAHLIDSEPENLLRQSLWQSRWTYADLLFGIGGIVIGFGCIGEVGWARKAGICFCIAALMSAVFWFADESNWDADIVRVVWITNILNPFVSLAALGYFIFGWPEK